MNTKPPRSRIGARGLRRVKSGCRTCKIRHIKCDESRPACSQCSSTGRQCDFTVPALPSSQAFRREQRGLVLARPVPGPFRHRHPTGRSNVVPYFESVQFEFFRLVCAPEYGLFFETPSWESLVLQSAITEPCVYHAALAISALTWNHYSPVSHWYDPTTGAISATEYSTIQYNLAIRRLNARLDSSAQDRDVTKIAILSAILFINIELLLRKQDSSIQEGFLWTHLRGATCLVRDLKSRFGPLQDLERECLEIGLSHIERQAQQLEENVVIYG
ncbi:hypothetical protein HD806DRAFT_146685 [Xylariaceae sp. AK1471]|nr:hypothetical protein HD806DRAFT_146685 [Xylariaceae sp. AK1471]